MLKPVELKADLEFTHNIARESMLNWARARRVVFSCTARRCCCRCFATQDWVNETARRYRRSRKGSRSWRPVRQ